MVRIPRRYFEIHSRYGPQVGIRQNRVECGNMLLICLEKKLRHMELHGAIGGRQSRAFTVRRWNRANEESANIEY
jgi:hypothetical protein